MFVWLMPIGAILFIVLVLVVEYVLERKEREMVKGLHRDFQEIKIEDIAIINGEVFVRYMNQAEYRRFRKSIKCNKRMRQRLRGQRK